MGSGGRPDKLIFFYTNNDLLTSTGAEQIQQEFNMLNNLFDRLGPRTNTSKMVSMLCQPWQSVRGHLAEAYSIWMTGV